MFISSHVLFFFFKQKTAYEMRISDWSSDVCSSDLCASGPVEERASALCRDWIRLAMGAFQRARRRLRCNAQRKLTPPQMTRIHGRHTIEIDGSHRPQKAGDGAV